MADQEFLASFGVEIDESGVIRLQAILRENRELAESLSAAFDAATESMKAFAKELPSQFSFDGSASGADVPSILGETGAGGTKTLQLGLDTAEAREDLASFLAEAKKPVPVSANMEKAVSAARGAFEDIRQIFSQPLTVTVRVQAETDSLTDSEDGDGPQAPLSRGGRFSRPASVRAAGDGDAEYIIPVKQENRAIPLLRQLAGELSPSAREGLGLHDAALPLSGGPAAGMASSVTVHQTSQNVSAPVSIQVSASGPDPERIGQGIYDAAERYLLRTMKGVFT